MFHRSRASNNIPTQTTRTTMTTETKQILEQYGTNLQTGLTTDQATQRREEAGSFNVVDPPINCPGWICCLLPCIKSIPSMKAFADLKPEDAEVLRNGKWIRYDAASLVKGDVIRMEEGDVVPADCILVEIPEEEELLVDLRPITGEERLKSITAASLSDGFPKIYMGGKVVQAGATAVITAIGPNTLLAKLIREKRFPPTEAILVDESSSSSDGRGVSMGDLS
jgi:magnesium-transporting ATPase (P-type)